MNTKQMMDIALKMANLKEMPADCGIIVEGKNIKKVLMGVDMDTAELMLAQQLGYDCVVSHHPRNTNADFADVLHDHIWKLEALGVPRNKSQKLLEEFKTEFNYNIHVTNSRRSESAAKLLGIPFICIHTPADIIGEAFLQEFLDKKFKGKPETTVKEVKEALEELSEYKDSVRKSSIRVGSAESYAGRIYVLMSGLTNPGPKILKEYFEAGVGTLVVMYINEKEDKEIKEQSIGNVIIAGHMSSDSLGLNKLAKEWAKHGVEITMMSGIVPASKI